MKIDMRPALNGMDLYADDVGLVLSLKIHDYPLAVALAAVLTAYYSHTPMPEIERSAKVATSIAHTGSVPRDLWNDHITDLVEKIRTFDDAKPLGTALRAKMNQLDLRACREVAEKLSPGTKVWWVENSFGRMVQREGKVLTVSSRSAVVVANNVIGDRGRRVHLTNLHPIEPREESTNGE